MKNKFTTVTYQNKKYIVSETNKKIPFIFDYNLLKNLPTSSFFLRGSYISTRMKTGKELYLHHIIKPYNGISVDHINRITQDNREINLRYATQAVQNKNQSKRKRNVELPENCGVKAEDIPTFIWYIKENGSHGDRWMVEVNGKYKWKTTSTKNLSTKCKFELAKKHLRNLLTTNPELFNGHCINGKLDELAETLKQEFIEILKLARYEYNDYIDSDNDNTDRDYLIEDITGLNENEISILRENNDYKQTKIKPPNFEEDVPKYCYYIKENNLKGDGFCCTKFHPKQKQSGKEWITTRSKKVSTKEKFKQLLEYINNKEYKPKIDIIKETQKNPKL